MTEKLLLIFFLTLLACSAGSQSAEKEAVVRIIENLFEGMRQGDTTMVSAVFSKDARMHTIFVNGEGDPVRKEVSLQRFLNAVGTPRAEVWDEPIWDISVKIDGNLAQVWTKYAFYLDKKFSHCGVDAFQLFKSPKGWKIFQLSDTRKTEGCTIPDHIKESRK